VPSPQMNAVISYLWDRKAARTGQPPRTIEEVRASLAPAGQLRALPGDVTVTSADAAGVPSYWLDVPGTDPGQVLLYLHGGGYTAGSLRSHGPLAAEIGRATGRRVLFPEYRLAPEHRFPAAVDDIATTWRWLRAVRGIGSVVVAGDSAGGGLALALLQSLGETGDATLAGAVLLSPALDLTASGASVEGKAGEDPIFTPPLIRGMGPAYLGTADPRDPAASPLFGSHVGLPPLLIQVGGAELLLSDSERLAKAAAEAGVNVTLDVAEGLPHVYQGALDTPESASALRQIADFASRVAERLFA
jgi:epsilon-lactone hydrolase